jgi:SAM-dependent methyltransferase
MYKRIKQIITKLIPKRLLFKYELIFRFILYLWYKGKNFQCNLCKKRLRKFIEFDADEKLCPYCGSLARNRRLWDIVNQEFLKDKLRILDFSPSRRLYRAFKNISFVSYTSTDLSGDFLADHKFDITTIDSQDEAYDLIICYHVLEHVEDDDKAMRELYRVLRPDGICIIQTPFKQGNIYEDPSITSKEDRLAHFGQQDHVRIYSVAGLKERLSASGFHVQVKEYDVEVNNRYGYHKKEFVLICSK